MKRISILLLAASSFAVPACSNDVNTGEPDPGTDPGGGGGGSGDQWGQILAGRQTDYSAALRTASVRLTGKLPSMTEIKQVADATGAAQKTAYETLVRDYMSRPTFAKQMFDFWRDTFKMGGSAMLDTAPAFAAKLTVENGDYRQLFTKATGNCPTFDGTSVFTDAECTNGGPKAGILTNTGFQAHYTSNFAFRRTRAVQELFDCAKFPTNLNTAGQDVGGLAPYFGKQPFASLGAPVNGGRVNFQDASAVTCANCHGDMNHITPLFAYYDQNGMYKDTISVSTPLEGAPLAKLSDYLVAGEGYAWRAGVPVTDIPTLGAAMAADPGIAKCAVARIWNWSMGKGDIVDVLQEVPAATIQTQIDAFTQNGFKMKDLIFAAFTADDFVKF